MTATLISPNSSMVLRGINWTTYQALIRDLAEEGGYVAEIPALKGCLAQGETLTESIEALEIVKTLWLETAMSNNQALPNVQSEIAQAKSLSRR